MIYTKEWAFIHIPKTSGMNFKTNAIEKFKGEIIKPYEDDDRGYLYMHNPYSYWEFILKTKWVFTIIRNPFTRAVSLWKFSNERKEKFIRRFGHHSFYDFYTNPILKTFDDLCWGLHSPQYDFVINKHKEIIVDTYRIESELPLLETKLGFTFTDTWHNTMKKYDYREIYQDKRNKRLVQEMFEIDFRTFGYDIDNI